MNHGDPPVDRPGGNMLIINTREACFVNCTSFVYWYKFSRETRLFSCPLYKLFFNKTIAKTWYWYEEKQSVTFRMKHVSKHFTWGREENGRKRKRRIKWHFVVFVATQRRNPPVFTLHIFLIALRYTCMIDESFLDCVWIFYHRNSKILYFSRLMYLEPRKW